MSKNNVTILAIESSCDETSAAVVVNGTNVLSCIVATQIPIHQRYGGVVPEIAARAHVEQINTVIEKALLDAFPNKECRLALTDHIDYIAVTHGPGLVGSLLVGVNAAKTLSRVFNKPLIPVNHIMGHVYSNFLEDGQKINSEIKNQKSEKQKDEFQISNFKLQISYITLVASGGHTDLILSKGHDDHKIIGQTRDDAAGEAFDKAAQLMKLPYPGGPSISEHAQRGDENKYIFPRGLSKVDTLNFSFSGLKTSLSQLIANLISKDISLNTISADLAASYQRSIVDSLVTKTLTAAKQYKVKHLFIAGGVSANKVLREKFAIEAKNNNLVFHAPNIEYCTDNAAMIGAAAYGSVLLNRTQNCYDVNVEREPELKL